MTIFVYADWEVLGGPLLMGRLAVAHTKGREVFSFEYDKDWIEGGHAQNLDPDLKLYKGPQYLPSEKKNFGIFLDSSPDRWGRALMVRREAITAKLEKRKAHSLFEEDYLLGVFDQHRMGAIRFKTEMEGPFLHNNINFAAPPWAMLRDLEFASLELEKDALTDEESIKWLNLLIAPGASLGGARPKASVMDPEGILWIAKFPSTNDQVDTGGWEMVVNTIARQSGLNMAEGKVRKFNSRNHTFLTKRFDRTGNNRHHFASAMTLLGYSDGADGVSYLDLAEFIMQNGSNVTNDLVELWRRIVFNISVKNTDDHLRNHGFILNSRGWALSPAFDVNPVYYGTGLTLNISETDNSLDLDLARSVAQYFRIPALTAASIIAEIQHSVANWQKIAADYHIPKNEQELMSRAFEI